MHRSHLTIPGMRFNGYGEDDEIFFVCIAVLLESIHIQYIEIMMMTLDGYVGWNSEFTSTKRDFNEFFHATI